MDGFFDRLKDPQFFCENRIYPHSDHVAYAPEDAGPEESAPAMRKLPGADESPAAGASQMAASPASVPYTLPGADAFGRKSSLRKYLNGNWKFRFSPNFAQVPEGFESPGYNVSAWEEIAVPGHIQLQGYDKPQYVNIQYPWDGHEDIAPGQIPQEYNPVANYVTTFSLPETFKGKRIFISFQGVESSFRLWLNGTYIGFSSDTFTPSEFELTNALKDGENTLAVQVFKWYAGSWLEDQDFFRFSGIFRDVYLYAAPAHHVQDVRITADYDPAAPGTGKITALFECLAGGGRLSAQLISPKGDLLETKQVQVPTQVVRGRFTAEIAFDVNDPVLWSAETPYLYSLKITAADESGRDEEWLSQRVGIRHFCMDGNVMKLNGKRIVFKGVNRHEFSSYSGRVVSYEELLRDLYNMKRSNINAIRLSHYPNSSPIYALADALGFYLIGECNMETHGTWEVVERGIRDASYALPGKNIQYMRMLLDRIHSMYQRDKNHPSIVIWSVGNESWGGPVVHEMSRELRKLDRTRLVHYEGIFHDRTFPNTSDIESQMYSPVARIREFLSQHRDKPFISCEYMHAMGNSCGALYKYTDLTDEDELYQGGFIWDYIDQALRKKDRYGHEYMGYGGDFEDRPNDGNFSGDGLVDADRNPTPKLTEVKYCYQNISVRFDPDTFGAGKTGAFTVINKNLFVNTDCFACVAILERNGDPVCEGGVETCVPALSEGSFQVPFVVPVDPGEYALTVSFRLKEDVPWAEKGFEAAFGQHVFCVEGAVAAQAGQAAQASQAVQPGQLGQPLWIGQVDQISLFALPGQTGQLRLINGCYNVGVKGDHFEALFSRLYGGLVSYRYDGTELLSGMVRPNFWRAPVDNDNGNMMPFRCAQWKTASLYADHKNLADLSSYFRLENPAVTQEDAKVRITYTYYLPAIPAVCTLSYLVDASGEIEVTLGYEPPADAWIPDLPEFSVMLKLDADYDQMEWYGKGPSDCYPDRKMGAKLGRYSCEVKDTVANYLVPQESGSHADVRWMKVTDNQGRGLQFACNNLSVSVSPYSPHELESAMHPFELPEVHYTYVRIGQQSGIGGDDSWGAMPHEEFLLKGTQPRSISFRLKGVDV